MPWDDDANGYDGIDIDYESLDPADRDAFSLFVEELANALHAEGKVALCRFVRAKNAQPRLVIAIPALARSRRGASAPDS
jgi:hypothetical protein